MRFKVSEKIKGSLVLSYFGNSSLLANKVVDIPEKDLYSNEFIELKRAITNGILIPIDKGNDIGNSKRFLEEKVWIKNKTKNKIMIGGTSISPERAIPVDRDILSSNDVFVAMSMGDIEVLEDSEVLNGKLVKSNKGVDDNKTKKKNKRTKKKEEKVEEKVEEKDIIDNKEKSEDSEDSDNNEEKAVIWDIDKKEAIYKKYTKSEEGEPLIVKGAKPEEHNSTNKKEVKIKKQSKDRVNKDEKKDEIEEAKKNKKVKKTKSKKKKSSKKISAIGDVKDKFVESLGADSFFDDRGKPINKISENLENVIIDTDTDADDDDGRTRFIEI